MILLIIARKCYQQFGWDVLEQYLEILSDKKIFKMKLAFCVLGTFIENVSANTYIM